MNPKAQKTIGDNSQIPSPIFILRGHSSEVHSLHFPCHSASIPASLTSCDGTNSSFADTTARQGNYLDSLENTVISGDATGYIIVWSLETYRPKAIWQAHTAPVVTIITTDHGDIITHGKDDRLYVWRIIQPLTMTTNFPPDHDSPKKGQESEAEVGRGDVAAGREEKYEWRRPWMVCSLAVNSLNFCSFAAWPYSGSVAHLQNQTLIATPALVSSELVDLWAIPSCDRLLTKLKPSFPIISARTSSSSPPSSQKKPHGMEHKTGTVMALSMRGDTLVAGYENGGCAVYSLDLAREMWMLLYYGKNHRDSILSVAISHDDAWFWSVGVDSLLIRYSMPLRGHSLYGKNGEDKKNGKAGGDEGSDEGGDEGSGQGSDKQSDKEEVIAKKFDTKHSGQASLSIRTDSRILATAGWDGNARIYSTKTLKPLAVLKWHKSGLLAVTLAHYSSDQGTDSNTRVVGRGGEGGGRGRGQTLVASAGKDGKIALWSIF